MREGYPMILACYGMDWLAIGTVATLVGLLIAVLMLVLGFRQFTHQVGGLHTQMATQVALAYTQRYEEIMARLPPQVRTRGLHNLPVAAANDPRMLEVFLRYANLCAEEQQLHQDGVVGDTAWAVWWREMATVMTSPFGKAAWTRLKAAGQFDAQPAFIAHVEAMQKV